MRSIGTLRSSLALACALTAILAVSCKKAAPQHQTAGDEPSRYRAAGFSYVPPQGWEVRDFPGLKYKIAAAAPADGFAPNLNVVDEAFAGSLDTYVSLNLQNLAKALPGYEKVSQETFRTADGVDATKLVVLSTQSNVPLRQLFYMVPASGKFYVVTCSDHADHKGSHDAECDAAAKTFRVD
jgi:hypothetical protein